jgi:hypothetical protein
MNFSDEEPGALEMFQIVQDYIQRAILCSIWPKGVLLAARLYLGRLGDLLIMGASLKIKPGETSILSE